MADKEERILIKWIVVPCNGCSGTGENVCDNCYDWDMWQSSPTRSEAIERMAKAICAYNMAPDCLWECETCDRWKGSDKEAAEAALNALLEDNNASKN